MMFEYKYASGEFYRKAKARNRYNSLAQHAFDRQHREWTVNANTSRTF
ncbi:MAG: hypothetical protein QOI59_1147 [Gammaproteobacteria bacterium]|nr:hypothetical protein [Gammaproteobacteria bacterium]